MSIPDPLVEMYLGGSWVDVSTGVAPNRWLDTAAAPLTITRGRENEQSDIAAGTCTFSLVNDDGRFTLANPSGAYSPDFKLWVQVRVTINGVREFTGYLSNAETSWDDDTGLNAHTAITCTDLLGMMAMSPNVRSWADSLISALSPDYWWKFSDDSAALTATAMVGGLSLVPTVIAGTADTFDQHITFGVEGPASLEADTQMSWSNTTAQAWKMSSSGTISGLATSFTVLCIFTPPKQPNYGKTQSAIVSLTQGSTRIELGRVSVFTIYRAIQAWQSFSGSPDGVASSGVADSPNVPVVIGFTITPADITLLGGGVGTRGHATNMNGSTVAVADIAQDDEGSIAHLAIVNRVMSSAEVDDLNLRLIGGVAPVSTWLNRGASEAGYGSAVAAAMDRTMERPNLKGSNPAELGSTLANSAGAAFVVTKAGDPKWLDFTDVPTRIDIAAGEWERGSAWAPDQSLYYSEVQFDGVVAATVPGAFPRKALDVQPLLPPTEQAAYATYLTNAQDVITGPRLSQISIDLATVATPATYQAIDLRSRIALAAVPSQIPAGGVMTVEGYTVSVGVDSWRLTLSTAPDPRFILGDSVAGVLASNYRLTPFAN